LGALRIIQVIYAHSIPATATRKAGISLTLYRRPILPTLPMKKLRVASPELITLGGPLHPKAAAKTVEAGDKGTRWRKFRSRINPVRLITALMKGISTSGFVMMKVEGMGTYQIQREGFVWEKRGLDRLFKTKEEPDVLSQLS
jgi:hypothetical protein